MLRVLIIVLLASIMLPSWAVDTVYTKPVKVAPQSIDTAKRMKQMEKDIIRPQGMEYTFGNDCDETNGLVYRRLGVTSIESYVTWESCEGKGKDQWDWSRWDTQVRNLKKTRLKWVPFLILSPAYSTPNWFRESSDHVPCACLEHGTKSKIESLWNPNLPKYIDRFIGEFAKRYKNAGVIESVLLGIQGDFGEAIYSVTGGGWTFNIPGEYHNHPGFWCNDPYALTSFREWLSNRYSTVNALNTAWGTSFTSFNAADFPVRGEAQIKAFRQSLVSGSATDRRKWLDFVQWYRESMTKWADFWMATTRKYFPKTEIYLCTGGDAPPEHGSDFAAQCKVAAKYKAGVRITNEGSNYQSNFVMTRWVAAAGKHYGAFYGFEPAGLEDENGVAVRIYNATASGAKQLHDYIPNIVNNPKSTENQQKYLKFLKKREPQVDVALFYPNTHMTLQWGGFFDKARALRDIIDYDFVDEGMIRDGALKRYKALVMLHGDYIEKSDLDIIRNWTLNGGVVIGLNLSGLKSVDGEKLTDRLVVPVIAERTSSKQGIVYDLGLSWDQRDAFFKKLVETLKEEGVNVPDGEVDGLFATVTKTGEVLCLNTTDKDADKIIGNAGVLIPAHSIFSLGR